MQTMNPLKLPLQGQILIEASAGTGKTYTIGLLFLRLLLERKLSVDDILVVTFTKAATEELRGRIRLRIREALDELEAPAETQADPLLQTLISNIQDKQQAQVLLADALLRMDEAAISTIHGFCQRMLQEYAFESGTPFELEFIESEKILRQRIIEDFWRLNFYTADHTQTTRALDNWGTPEALLNALGGHLEQNDIICLPEIDETVLAENELKLKTEFSCIQTQWIACAEEFTTLLRESNRLSIKKDVAYSRDRLSTAIRGMQQFIEQSIPDGPLPKEIELFTRSKLEESIKKTGKGEPPDHPFLDQFETFYSLWKSVDQAKTINILLDARHYLKSQLTIRKQQQAQLYFDDLLIGLDSALQGPSGMLFAQAVSRRFPLILVDEFQDTDPLQYRIFSSVFRANRIDSGTPAGLFLIGDPKQAIYAFRGADIFTYLQARKDTAAENRFTMDSNYRSSRPMVEAVNQLFDQAASFLFENISFPRVNAAGRATREPLLIDGSEISPMNCLLLTENDHTVLTKAQAGIQAAEFCAREIAALLSGGLSGKNTVAGRPLGAADIAILVRTHDEANQIRKALSQLNISSVYYSQESVFESDQAIQLLQVLESLDKLTDEASVRTALTTPLFGYSAEQINHLLNDEDDWASTLAMLSQYRTLERDKGFALFFQTLLAQQNMVQRLLVQNNGERSLTNFLHLAELIQSTGPDNGGLTRIVRWLRDQIQAPEKQSENQQLRLESDENLVKIVTIHASKGLEYALVFLPFLWSNRRCDQKKVFSFHSVDKPGQLCIDLGSGEQKNFQQAEKERLAGDLRLLYVAITRARYGCYFCWGRIKLMEHSAMYYLLHRDFPGDDDALRADLKRFEQHPSKILIHTQATQPDQTPDIIARTDRGDPALKLNTFTGHIDRRWRITSYSGLLNQYHTQAEQPDYDLIRTTEAQVPGLNAFGFPRGADAGICLHAIMEHIPFNDRRQHAPVIREQLSRAAYPEQWQPVLETWLRDILETELRPGFSLSQLNYHQRIDEMAFYFPLNSVNRSHINTLLDAYFHQPLPAHNMLLHGLMSGFIDLIFEHQGQFFIADYKSNHLGNHSRDYASDQLQAAMDEHRYDLQYLIYCVALHRYLARKIPDYSYAQHFGGVYYLFMRGMNPAYPDNNGVYFQRPEGKLITGLDQLFAGVEEPHA